MKIQINHIAKMEGHSDFVADILAGDVKTAKMKTKEGARLFEGIMIGRDFRDAPIIAQRICGICPVVHGLNTIKTIEKIFGVKVSEQTLLLRKLLKYAQVIHSHGIHLFFLSLPDFFDLKNDLKLVKEYPEETQAAVLVRKFGTEIVRVVGGRTVHMLSIEVGGFKKIPSLKDFRNLLNDYNRVYDSAMLLVKMFKKLKYPQFERKTDYISLFDKNEYAIYQGDINVNGEIMPVEDFYGQINELHLAGEKVKRTKFKDKSYMLGALARVNNNYEQLDIEAKKIWDSMILKKPVINPFYNVLAQAVELVHCLEESRKIIEYLSKKGLKESNVSYKIKSGVAVEATEAPRGILIDSYSLDENGTIVGCNIITPTAQFLANLEDDLEAFVPQSLKLTNLERRNKIRTLIRAYDPCISCATH